MGKKIFLGRKKMEMDTTLLDYLSESGCFIEIMDIDGTYVYCSRNRDIYDYLAFDMIGKTFEDVYKNAMTNTLDNPSILKKTIQSEKRFNNVFWKFIDPNGKEYHWIVDSSPIYIQSELVGAISISRPFQAIKKAVEGVTLLDIENFILPKNPNRKEITFHDIIYQSKVMNDVVITAKKIATGKTSVLIMGETGTGKELFAQSIHNAGLRKDKPFVAINCSAIPESLLESTLFGTSKGAFTGAYEKKGLFEEAEGGTLFLDELNSMNIELQAKLLRALETKKIRRVGATSEIATDIRLISAINMDPFECMQHETLRKDLFYRVAVTSLEIPPLRARSEDIDSLCEYYIMRYNYIYSKSVFDIGDSVKQLFYRYQWPGNVRELQHIIEHAISTINSDEYILTENHLPRYFKKNFETGAKLNEQYLKCNYNVARTKMFEQCEKQFVFEYIIPNIKSHGGNISKTAEELQVSRRQLHHLLKKYAEDMVVT